LASAAALPIAGRQHGAAPFFGVGRTAWEPGVAPDLGPGYPAELVYADGLKQGAAQRFEFCYAAAIPWGWPGELVEADVFERLRAAAARASHAGAQAELRLGNERGHQRSLAGGDAVGQVALGFSDSHVFACGIICTPGSMEAGQANACAEIPSARLEGVRLVPAPAPGLGLRVLLGCAARPEATFGACLLMCGVAASAWIARRARPSRRARSSNVG